MKFSWVRILVILLPTLLCLPYLGQSGLRVEHLIVYILGALGLLKIICYKQPVEKKIIKLLIFWLLAILFAIVSTYWSIFINAQGQFSTKTISGIEHYTRPLFCLAAGIYICNKNKNLNSLLVFIDGLFMLLSINTLLILLQLATGNATIFPFFQPPITALEVSDGVVVRNLWEASVEMGRFTGIFYAPMESGVFYGVGLFLWLQNGLRFSRTKDIVLLILIMIGGILSVSKVFIVVALVLFMIGLCFCFRAKLTKQLVASAALGLFSAAVLLKNWDGYYLIMYFMGQTNSDIGIIERITSHRFGDANTQVNELFNVAYAHGKWFGLGVNPFPVMDNELLLWFAELGLIGLVLLLCIYCSLFLIFRRKYRDKTGLFIPLFILGAALGGPVVTITKASSVLWFLAVFWSMEKAPPDKLDA